MDFDYVIQRLENSSASLEYYEVPWDTEICGFLVAQISAFNMTAIDGAEELFEQLEAWKRKRRIQFSSCRLKHSAMARMNVLQKSGYRFVELNYRPERSLETTLETRLGEFSFEIAQHTEKAKLAGWAETTFDTGRFHADPALGSMLGNLRYRVWMENAFESAHQEVIVCKRGREIEAFFVTERQPNGTSFWSLVGLRPERKGAGIAKRIWRSMLAWERLKGTQKVVTSISSLNTPVLNLYCTLGFRFPEPDVTFHWHAKRK